MTEYWVLFDFDMVIEDQQGGWSLAGPKALFVASGQWNFPGGPVYPGYAYYPWGLQRLPYAGFATEWWVEQPGSIVHATWKTWIYTVNVIDFYEVGTEAPPENLIGGYLSDTKFDAAPPGNWRTVSWTDWAWALLTYPDDWSPSGLFTLDADLVDFNNLTAAQADAIENGAPTYAALSGNDWVVLPNLATSLPVPYQTMQWASSVTFNAGRGDDHVWGGDRDDRIDGWEGDDHLYGRDGNDILYGGDGNDHLSGGLGDDLLFGGDGDDTIYGVDSVEAGATEGGDNEITGGAGFDTVRWSGDYSSYDKEFSLSLKQIFLGEGEYFKFSVSSVNGEDILQDRIEQLVFNEIDVSLGSIQAAAGFKWALDSMSAVVDALALWDELTGGETIPEELAPALDWYLGIKGIVAHAIEVSEAPNKSKALFVNSSLLLVDAAELFLTQGNPVVGALTTSYFDDVRLYVRAGAGTVFDDIMASTLPVSDRLGEYFGELWHGAADELGPKDIEALPTEPFVPEPQAPLPPTLRPLSDFTGDGTSDILWTRADNIAVGSFHMDSGAPAFAFYGHGGGGWKIAGTGDFSGNGSTDILWHAPSTNALGAFILDSGAPAFAFYGTGGDGWTIAGTGDFTGDGTDDILWNHAGTNAIGAFVLDSGAPVFAFYGSGGDGWQIVGTGDFTGDGTTDILWHQSSSNAVGAFIMDSGTPTFAFYGNGGDGWAVAGTGDFSGDGTDDILWHYAATNAVGAFIMDSGTPAFAYYNNGGDGWAVAGTGDYSGDGTYDILWHQGSTNAIGAFVMDSGAPAFAFYGHGGHGWQLA